MIVMPQLTSNMGFSGAIGFSFIFAFLTQIPYMKAKDCKITSIASPGPSSLNIKWSKYIGATYYFLDLRVINSTDIAPVVVTLTASVTEKAVQGLRPGTKYSVTIKVFQFFFVMCQDRQAAITVPATSQITHSRALTSTSIRLDWARVPSSQRYFLLLESQQSGEQLNLTFTNTSAVVESLRPATVYHCYVYTANEAGVGVQSRAKSVRTLVKPPVRVMAEQIGRRTANVTWQPVDGVLLYQVTVRDKDEPNGRPLVVNVTGTELTVQDILPCSTYMVSVSSVTTFLEPGESTDLTYTTNTLNPVMSVSVDYSCTSGSAMVSWLPVFGAESYRVKAVNKNGTVLSCTSTSTECQIFGVGCGQSYQVHVIALSESCESRTNTPGTTFETVPCPPENLQLYRECSSNTIIFSWDHTNHSDYYNAKAVDSQGVVQKCLTTENSCFFTSTVCGRRYTFTVYSSTRNCNSQISLPVEIQMAPCMPRNIQTSADCWSDVLVNTWDVAEGALFYTVEAWGNRGDQNRYNCSSTNESCVIWGLHCGEHLSIYITAFDNECSSTRTLGQVAETVPCIPQNVSATMDCGADSIVVNWEMTAGAVFYIGTAVDDSGMTHTCHSMENSCQIKGLKCSTAYTAFVTASNFKCNSSNSEKVSVETAQCPPDHIQASLDCAANQALISWQGQPNMISYTAAIVDATGGLLSCSTTKHRCRIPNLKCGQLYVVSVSHHDGVCSGMPSKTIYMESVPCGPVNVHTSVDCQSAELSIGWNASRHVESYIAIITSSDGFKLNCNSTEPWCSTNMLECGQQYKVEVMSVNGTCLSFPSKTVVIREAPCVPTNMVVERSCGSNTVEVSWQASRGAKLYTAVATGSHSHHSSCSSNGTVCSLEELMCSEVYNISVFALDDACSSTESVIVTLHTVPCPPSHLRASVNCVTNSATLSWDATPNSEAYFAMALGTDGHNVSCDGTLNLGCQLDGLHCGQEYMFSVSASDINCRSVDNEGLAQVTGPCAPQSVVNTLDCDTNSLTVSWALGSIQLNYSAIALAGDGSSFSCTTEGASCEVNDFQCGQEYSVSVKAVSSECEGPSTAPQAVQSVPCVPSNIHGAVECSSNTLRASWGATRGAVSFISMLSEAEGFSTSCSTALHECSFPNLQCARQYTLSVVALDNRCNSSVSAGVFAMTAPCDPESVTAVLDCNSGTVMVTWESRSRALAYTVLAQATSEAHVTSCHSTDMSCELHQLQCGKVHTVTVLGADGTCNSTMLASTTVTTAPCPPLIKGHSLDCASNHVLISWAEDEDMVRLVVNATSTLGHASSCGSTFNTSCVLDDLLCGQTYSAQAVAKGNLCNSAPSSSFEIVTAPCTPDAVVSKYTCGTSIALLSWEETLGRERFYVSVRAGQHVDYCNTTKTHCPLTSLLCGQLYDVTIDAVAAQCSSRQSAASHIQTAPCAPQNISAALTCYHNTMAVTWLASPGAVGYNVTAKGRDGDTKHCTTSHTGCDLSDMQCAQMYEIVITPFSDTCKGFDSTVVTFISGPCPPANVQASLQCEGNVGYVSWSAALAADLYQAIATGEDGLTHTCSSANVTGCSFVDLRCGQSYEVRVVTMERGCQSEPSLALTLKSAICPPANVTGVTECGTNDLTVSWDPSPLGGVTYFLHSQREDGANATFSISGTSHVITGQQCGQRFTVTVSAQASVCTSALSHPIQIDTAPCAPTNLTARADCGTNRGTLSWEPGTGAVSYTATVTCDHGKTLSCSSNNTSCFVKLDCGHHYTAAVVASTVSCNRMGVNMQFDSAPCLPDNMVAELDCAANSFAVQWQESNGDAGTYTAIAIGDDGTRVTCNTASTACTIQNLRCGLIYSIAVTTSTTNCDSIEGSDYQLQSAPCKPDNPAVNLDCSTNVAVISWENTGPDQVQVVSVVDARGFETTCNSILSNCTFNQLHCGQAYTLSVTGHTKKCHSETSSHRLLTAPCVPTHLIAEVDCETGITVVTWDPALGATGYTVYAQGSGGNNATCANHDTNCAFPALACGQDYTITVVAQHDNCASLASDPITATTGPCPHTALQASLDCSSNMALVSWKLGRGILTYNASAEGFDVTHHLTCTTEGSACNISSLRCGERYRMSVKGEGRTCPSPARDWTTINTAPCPPTQLNLESSCDSDTISVSWQASQALVSYRVVADSPGHRLYCNTSTTSCQISSLLCGQEYQVYTTGIDENCWGTKSNIQVIHTAPCAPQEVHSHLDCWTGTLSVTWQQSGDAHHYHTTVRSSSSGHMSICDTEELRCVVTDMLCGQNYSVVVVAHNHACNSSHSPAQYVATAPCPLETFLLALDCATNVAAVTWNGITPGAMYTVSAMESDELRHNCSAPHTGCDLGNLECGREYNVTITPSRDTCMGSNSPYQLIRTAPCVPRLTDVEMDCLSDSAWVMWEESARVDSYVVVATDGHGQVQRFDCNSTDSTCVVPDMSCGHHLNFTLIAIDQQCSSAASNTVFTETAPCPPQDVQSAVGCESRTVSVSWAASYGALTYTATLERTDGQTTCCTTANTGCNITDLRCGEMYVLLLTAEGQTCNSSQSTGAIVRTEPCVPQNLQASLSCSSNIALVSWNRTRGGQQYRVEALGADGHNDGCSSHENSCELSGLLCGQFYTATVVAEDSDCTSMQSDSVEIKTVPCTPANVSTLVNCEANSLSVSWAQSAGADSYTATVEDGYGQSTTCQAMGRSSCNVTGLTCGYIYRVSMVSSDGHCDSLPTNMVAAHSVPCGVSDIWAVRDCDSRTALLSWHRSSGATMYTAVVSTVSGHTITCETRKTHCEVGGLACGQSYSVSVQAQGETCSTEAHMTGELLTEPCVPRHITTKYSLTIGQVMWDASDGATSYWAAGLTKEGLAVACGTNDTYCAMHGLACGQVYNVSVTARNPACHAVKSTELVAIKTEPCPPNNVQTRVECNRLTGIVSWEMSYGAVGYVAHLDGRDSHSLSCHVIHTSCSMEGLHCGTIYYTSVIALGEELNSSDSTIVLLVSAPCRAEEVIAEVDCNNDTALVSWNWVNGAQSYVLRAAGSDVHSASCETEESYCHVTELLCSQTYNLSLVAIGNDCITQTDTRVSFTTRPCGPLHVGVDFQCGTSTANLYWEPSEGVKLYTTTGASSGGSVHCNSSGSTCHFSSLCCGETYRFSVQAQGSTCQSQLSFTSEIQTEPCMPEDLTATGSCNSDAVVLDWSEAEGAAAYTVSAVGDLGYIAKFQTNNTMLKMALSCGQTYTFHVKAHDDRCDSPMSAAAEFRTSPCVPQHVESSTQCGDQSLGDVRWAPSDGAESYVAMAVGLDGHTHMCVTNTSSCAWEDLHCGQRYVVHIVAIDNLCSSAPSDSVSIHMAPCVPQNLKSSLDCSTKVGSLTWNISEAAEIYVVKAETNSGHRVQLSTNDTRAQISEFLCGEEYFLSVQAGESICWSAPSPPLRVRTVPCPPTSVSSSMDCLSNIAVVSWIGSTGAEFYTATVMHEEGQSENCLSATEQCGTPNLLCGENYTVTVTASNPWCISDPSKPSTLRSVPCVPTNVEVEVDCSDNTAAVYWNSSQGAISYEVKARSSREDVSSCQSTYLGCSLRNLTCGQSYFVQVVALGKVCSSLPSRAATFHTVPCTPTIGASVLDCFIDSLLLDWVYVEGAVSYTVTARAADGHTANCTTNYTNCELAELHCGQAYTVAMVASNVQCNSFPSSSIQIASMPCPPEAVVTTLDCSSNLVHVEWQASGGVNSYLVQAIGTEEHVSGCKTDSNSCVVEDLLCSFTYNISVTAIDSHCNVSQSSITKLHTVPCVPNQVEADLDCESGIVSIFWEPSEGAISYTVIAQGSGGGYTSYCNSSGTTCQFGDLLCGLSYSFTVSASDDIYTTAESSAVQLNTVPCVPQRVEAEMQCSNNTCLVLWEQGEGVVSYLVHAVGVDGHAAQCKSTATSCQIPSMHCGQRYNLTVTAQDGRCDNSYAYLDLQSVPCSPINVRASMGCLSNSAMVTWERASGAQSYYAQGVAVKGSHWASCDNNVTSCELSGLLCGQAYKVSVFSWNEACSSAESQQTSVQTAPCPPQDVTMAAQCAAGAVSVSWAPDQNANSFQVKAVSDTGARLTCASSGTSCSLRDLPCGHIYSVTVVSVKDGCESEPSATVEVWSAPCLPRKPFGSLDCVTNSAWVSWGDSSGALSYTVLAQGVGVRNSSCTTSSTSCNVPDLECGTLYTFHMTSSNNDCQSTNSTTFQLETGPCALTSIAVVTECHSNTILVSWGLMENSPIYLVTAEGHDHSLISCNSSSTSCELNGARCSMQYTLIVSASSDKCSSLRSPPRKIHTAPCVPDSVIAEASCEEEGARVSWSPFAVATSFALVATGRSGDIRTCNTTLNNCTLANLTCGRTYSFTVTASDANCTSQPSASVSLRTVPCEPSDLSVDLQCRTSSAVLTWAPSEGSVEYFAFAQSKDGDILCCYGTDTSCTILDLECGGTYNFSIKASDGVCNSSFSTPLLAGAAPCAPTTVNVRMRLMGENQWLKVSWDAVDCIDVEYLVKITGRLQDNPMALMDVSSYWTNRQFFELVMPCSTAFNLTVHSRNAIGASEPSISITGITAPCTPQGVTYTRDSQSSIVSWEASMLSTHYTVYNISVEGGGVICTTSQLSCPLTDVDPDTIEVTASNAVGESATAINITGPVLNRGKRDLREIQFLANLVEDLNVPQWDILEVTRSSLHMTWTEVMDAIHYALIVTEQQARGSSLRVTVDTSYTLSHLKSGTRYCIVLVAKNTMSRSPFSKPKCATTDVAILQ